jgi:hypothetical protein
VGLTSPGSQGSQDSRETPPDRAGSPTMATLTTGRSPARSITDRVSVAGSPVSGSPTTLEPTAHIRKGSASGYLG